MHAIGANETNDDYSYEDNSSSEQNGYEITTRIARNPTYENDNSYTGKFHPYLNVNNGNNYNGGYNNYNNWNASAVGGMKNHRDYSSQFPNQYPDQSNNFDSSGTNKNQTNQDRACLVHCFFHELKMVIMK